MWSEDALKSQFTVLQALFPDATSVGVIYSADNDQADEQIEVYTALAEELGINVSSVEILDEIDIDLAASELVGAVDCVFCMEDDTVDSLIQTLCAYADEVGIPVIGLDESHVKSGCIAADDDGVLCWNGEKAGKLGLDIEGSGFEETKEYR